MRKRRDPTILIVTTLGLLVVVAIILGTDPAWFRNLREAWRLRNEGWSVVKKGDFVPLTLRLTHEGYSHPGEFRSIGTSLNLETCAVMYFSANKDLPVSDLNLLSNGKEPKSYAKIVTPKGSDLVVPIDQGYGEPGVCSVQIPAVYPPDTKFLEIHLVCQGMNETIVKMEHPPTTIDNVPQDGSVVDKVQEGDITITGEAFPAAPRGQTTPTALGYRVKWSKPSQKLTWRAFLTQSAFRPYTKNSVNPSGNSFSSVDALEAQSSGMVEAVPYFPEVRKLAVKGRLDGYETASETVDFGTMSLLKVLSSDGFTEHYLDFSKPITRTLPSGLRLTLLPLRSHKGLTTSLDGSSLYFRLRVEPQLPVSDQKTPPILGEPVIVEAKLLGTDDTFHTISPDPQAGQSISNVVFMWWKPTRLSDFPVKFHIQRRLLRKRIPFDFRLPIDSTKIVRTHLKGHHISRESVSID